MTERDELRWAMLKGAALMFVVIVVMVTVYQVFSAIQLCAQNVEQRK